MIRAGIEGHIPGAGPVGYGALAPFGGNWQSR